MKSSNYNIIINKDSHSYWFNTLTFNFFKLSKALSDKIYPLLNDLGELEKVSSSFMEKLKDRGFIVDDDHDELEAIREANERSIHRKDYFLVILPTLDCNYSCWYCIQTHTPSKMSQETMERVKKHIDHMINVEKIESLTVDWFGGEPLLYIRDVIEPLSRYMSEVCRKAGIPFYNGATTNGFHLCSLEPKIEELGFRRFHITLDGNRKHHDKVKYTDGCISTFDHVLRNIDRVLRQHEDVRLLLRINYTHENMDESIVDEVSKHITPEVRNRVTIVPRRVWQESVNRSMAHLLSDTLIKFQNAGFIAEWWNFNTDFTPCYANRKYYNAIVHDGRVMKCTATDDLHDPTKGGHLRADGTIEWKDGLESKFLTKSFENERCLSCKKLPICMGECPRNFLRGQGECKMLSIDADFNESVANFIEQSLKY